jgi:hypothetical protein
LPQAISRGISEVVGIGDNLKMVEWEFGNWNFGIGNWELGIAIWDFGVRIESHQSVNRKSEIPNPKSQIATPQSPNPSPSFPLRVLLRVYCSFITASKNLKFEIVSPNLI